MLNKLKRHKEKLHDNLIATETNFIIDSILTFFILLLCPIIAIVTLPYYLFIWLFTGILSISDYFIRLANKGKEVKRIKSIIKDYEKRITKDGLLSLKGYALYEGIKEPHVFIHEFIKTINYQHYTIDSDNRITCGLGRRRSIGDIYLITKYYFPKVTLGEVVNILHTLCENETVHGHYCYDINKFVFKNIVNVPTRGTENVDKDTLISFEQLVKYYNQ